MKCVDCPDLQLSDEQLAEFRKHKPDFQLREICCIRQAKLEEEARSRPDSALMQAKMRAAETPYRGGPRNRHERRAAAKKARAR